MCLFQQSSQICNYIALVHFILKTQKCFKNSISVKLNSHRAAFLELSQLECLRWQTGSRDNTALRSQRTYTTFYTLLIWTGIEASSLIGLKYL